VDEILALVGFAIVSSVTPGPNNMLLWASGAGFGARRTVGHVLGTALGIGSMALAVVVGIGTLITAVPQVELAMKVVGSLYLLYLAYQVAGAGALQRGAIARPLGIAQAAAFQVINPKAWTFAVGAVTTFRPSDLSSFAGGAVVAVVMMLVTIPTAALWAAAGGAFSRLLVDERTHRIVNLVLAALLALSVVSVWV